MRIDRMFTKDLVSNGQNIFDVLEWKNFDVCLKDHRSDKILYQLNKISAPAHWSQQSIDVMASKYFRRSGVPYSTKSTKKLPDNLEINSEELSLWPSWLLPSVSNDSENVDTSKNGETSVKQVFHRLAGAWTFWGKLSGILDIDGQISKENLQIFYDEIVYMLYHQIAAPNSPQFFNTGVWWAYGIEGEPCGHAYADFNGSVHQSSDLYSRSQAHACFILGIEDNLLDENGIYDLLRKEARIFKLGSGAGTNFSNLRAEGEKLSGGGSSSGLISFLRIFDRAADCIKSGGITRRAAKMLVTDVDHPDILEYIEWKSKEEKKAQTLINAGYEADFNGEAYKTVSGQNGNNSVAVSHDFMKALQEDRDWSTWWRTDKKKYTDESGHVDWDSLKKECKPANACKSSVIWNKMIDSSWKCADPAIHFNGTMNDWNTLASDGRIQSTNPCSEYISLNDTACNLASINVEKLFDNNTKTFDIQSYKHSVRIWQMILEITNHMAQLPSEQVAYNVWKYRSTGLGPANLGTLLMLMGLPYDHEESRTIAASLMGIMTGYSYAVSAEMAEALGPFPGYNANRNHMLKVIKNHRSAAYGMSSDLDPKQKQELMKHVGDYKDLTVPPVPLNDDNLYSKHTKDLIKESRICWDEAVSLGGSFGFRNSQVTVCAPTGTISMIMGCDSTGIEPFFALVTYKTLAGGGLMKLVNSSVKKALENLNCYNEKEVENICKFIQENGHVNGSGLKTEHEKIFECAASPLGEEGIIRWDAHIKMLASLQSFVSGGISKTINMPESATHVDISEAWKMAYRLGCKGISIYRDNCKMSAPLATSENKNPITEDVVQRITDETIIKEIVRRKNSNDLNPQDVLDALGITNEDILELKKGWGERRRPGDVLNGLRFRIKIGQAHGYVQIFIYPDGRICEFFLTFGNPGSSLNNMLECWSIAFSIALQRGESLRNLCSKFINVEFEPKGFTGRKDDLRRVTSPVDYIVRLMLMYFDDEGYIKDPSIFTDFENNQNNNSEETEEGTTIAGFEYYNSEEKKNDNTSIVIQRSSCPKCGALMTGGTDKCPVCPSCGFFGGCG